MRRTLLLLLALLCLASAASAEVSANGVIQYGAAITQLATMGGRISRVNVMAGEYVRPGDALVTLSPNRVYAPCSGTVESVFAGIGQSADAATQQYGGAVTIAPESLYTIYATAENAYKSVRTSRFSSGQEVYMKCTKDGTHRGMGRITRVDGDIFLVEVTGGSFYNGETVYVYMESDCDSSDRLGKGTAVAATAESVKAEGFVSRIHVHPGDYVEKGQLLLETLSELPSDGFLSADCVIPAQAEGYVTAIYAEAGADIERGGMLIDFCPVGSLEVIAQVGAEDLPSVNVGSPATVILETAEETLRLGGTVAAVAYIPETSEDNITTYAVRISFNGTVETDSQSAFAYLSINEITRPGMHVAVLIE